MSECSIDQRAGVTSLRPLQNGDAPRFHRLINDWEICRLLPEAPFPYPDALAQQWIDAAITERKAGRAFEFAILDDQGSMIGSAGLRLDKTGQAAAIGYWIGRKFWGQGHGSRAVGELLRWGFAELAIGSITAMVAADNATSLAVLRRVGFVETGAGHAKFIGQPGALQAVRHFAINRERLDFGTKPVAEHPEPIQAGTKLLLVAACALVDKHGQILIARRPPGKKLAGLWEFPGGKLAPGETPEAALVRELEEELGIVVAEDDLAPFAFASHPYEQFHLLMPLYFCRRWRGTPEPREGQSLAWVAPDRLEEYPMPPADRPLIPLLRDFL